MFFDIFLKSPVCRIVPENLKEGTLWDFLNIHSVAKYQKIEGGPFGDKKWWRKVSQSQNNTHKKFWSKGEIRTHVLLLRRPQKILINLYAKWQ